MRVLKFFFVFALILVASLEALSIDEKRAESVQKRESSSNASDLLLQKVNRELISLRSELEECFTKAAELYQKEAHAEEYASILSRVCAIKSQMLELQEKWREASVTDNKMEEEGYALWDQEDGRKERSLFAAGSSRLDRGRDS